MNSHLMLVTVQLKCISVCNYNRLLILLSLRYYTGDASLQTLVNSIAHTINYTAVMMNYSLKFSCFMKRISLHLVMIKQCTQKQQKVSKLLYKHMVFHVTEEEISFHFPSRSLELIIRVKEFTIN